MKKIKLSTPPTTKSLTKGGPTKQSRRSSDLSKSGEQDNSIELLLTKCQNSKTPERRNSLLELQSYFYQNESTPLKLVDKIGSKLCEMFDQDMDYLKGMRSLFLDILNSFLLHHAQSDKFNDDLENIKSRLLHRTLISLDCINPELDGSIYVKLTKTFEILSELMTFDSLFLTILCYLRKEGQNPTTPSKTCILTTLTSMLTPCKNKTKDRLNNALALTAVKVEDLQLLVQNILDWGSCVKSPDDIKEKCEAVFSLFQDKVSLQTARVWSHLGEEGQNQGKIVLKSHLIRQLWALTETIDSEVTKEINPIQDDKIDTSDYVLEEFSDDLYTTILLELDKESDSDSFIRVDDPCRTESLQKLEFFINEMTLDDQFVSVSHYLRDPISKPTCSYKIFALLHLRYLICEFHKNSLNPDPTELQLLLPKLLRCCGRINTTKEIRDKGRGIVQLIFMGKMSTSSNFDQLSTEQQQLIKILLRPNYLAN